MIIHPYRHLLFQSDPDGVTLLHTIVTSGRPLMLPIVRQLTIAYVTDFNSLDKDKNNLLHYTGKLVEGDGDLEEAYYWFRAVGQAMPLQCKWIRNKIGDLPEEFFWREYAELLTKKEAFLKKKAESSMIVATVMLAMVVAAAFAHVGGFYQEIRFPILLHRKTFISLMICEFMAIFILAPSIMGFLRARTSKRGNHYITFVMPQILKYSILVMNATVLFAAASFISFFYLAFVKKSSKVAIVEFSIPVVILILCGYLFWGYKWILKMFYISNSHESR